VTDRETELRELCAWYEWAEPPNLLVAGLLQDSADALRVRGLSVEAADSLIAVWQPFVGVEAQVGNMPELMAVGANEAKFQRGIVTHMRRMVAEEARPARRARLARLLENQIEHFGKGSR